MKKLQFSFKKSLMCIGTILLFALVFMINSVEAGGPYNLTATAKSATQDTTADVIADVQADDVSGATPSKVATDDGWYTVDGGPTNGVMFLEGFNTTNMSGTVLAAVLEVQYSVEAGYTGGNYVTWALDGLTLSSTPIQPIDGEVDKVATYDLFAQGVDTLDEIATLDIEFTNNDPPAADAVSFDYVFIRVTTNATWESYNDSAWTQQDDTFYNTSGTQVYMFGPGYNYSTTYDIAYYYPNDSIKYFADNLQSNSSSYLNDIYTVDGSDPAGIYKSAVYPDGASIPSVYAPADSNIAAQDAFTLEEAPVPEFGYMVIPIMMSGVLYLWMRERLKGSK